MNIIPSLRGFLISRACQKLKLCVSRNFAVSHINIEDSNKLEVAPGAAIASGELYLFGQNPLSFENMGVHKDLCDAVLSTGKHTATSIQKSSFGHVLEGRDVVIASETGSGKTLAYLIVRLWF